MYWKKCKIELLHYGSSMLYEARNGEGSRPQATHPGGPSRCTMRTSKSHRMRTLPGSKIR